MPKVGQKIAENKPKIEVINADCLKWLSDNPGRKYPFIFVDPPFNIGQNYEGYDDKKDPAEYRLWIWKVVEALSQRCEGVMCLHGPDDLAEQYLAIGRHLNMRRIAWVNWHYRFGQCTRSNWIDARCHCLIYARYKAYTWNPEEVLVNSDRAEKYNDKRVNETERGGKRLPGTVWGVPSDGPNWGRVQGNNRERWKDRPNQLPEVYLARLLRAYTKRGDWVLDPFSGTGTTSVVAQALGRSCTALDVSESACEGIRERLERGSINVSSA